MQKKRRIVLIIIILVSFLLLIAFLLKINSLKLPTGDYVCFGLNNHIIRLINGKPDEVIPYENDTKFENYNKRIADKTIIAGFNYKKPFNRLNIVTYEFDSADEQEVYQNILDFYQKEYDNVVETTVDNEKYITINDTYKVGFYYDDYQGEKKVGIMIYKMHYSYWGEPLE